MGFWCVCVYIYIYIYMYIYIICMYIFKHIYHMYVYTTGRREWQLNRFQDSNHEAYHISQPYMNHVLNIYQACNGGQQLWCCRRQDGLTEHEEFVSFIVVTSDLQDSPARQQKSRAMTRKMRIERTSMMDFTSEHGDLSSTNCGKNMFFC